jgi:hypothetical protein
MSDPEGLAKLKKIFGAHRVGFHKDPKDGMQYVIEYKKKLPEGVKYDSDVAADIGAQFALAIMLPLSKFANDLGIDRIRSATKTHNGEMRVACVLPARLVEAPKALFALKQISHVDFTFLEAVADPSLETPTQWEVPIATHAGKMPPATRVLKSGDATLGALQAIFPKTQWQRVEGGYETLDEIKNPQGVALHIMEALNTKLPMPDRAATRITIPAALLTEDNLAKIKTAAFRMKEYLEPRGSQQAMQP